MEQEESWIRCIKPLIFFLFCLISHNSYAMFEEMWEDITPNGKHIYYYEDDNDGIVYSAKIYNLSKWYFYKGYTIGMNQKDSLGNTFFASDEVRNKVYQFKDEKMWMEFLTQNNLNPLYTRWYHKYWSISAKYDGPDGFVNFFLLVGTIFLIFIILVISFIGNLIAYFLNKTETPFSFFSNVMSIIWKIIWKSVLFLWIPLFIINYFLGAFPQSF